MKATNLKYRYSVTPRFGFTLTELLVVIVIIALLAGVTTVVTRKAMVNVRNSLVLTQMTQIGMALDQYKAKYGEYPPDFSDTSAVMRHVRKRWPRYGVSSYAQFASHIMWGSQLSAQIDSNPVNTNYSFAFSTADNYWDFSNGYNFTAGNTTSPCCHIAPLVFWLGGLPGATGQPAGFFNSPSAPLGFDSGIVTVGDAAAKWNRMNLATLKVQREDSFFDFSQSNIITAGHVPGLMIRDLPLVYFRAGSNVYVQGTNMGAYACPWNKTGSKYYAFSADSGLGVAAPYCHATPGKWYEDERYQIVYPGEDKSFGNPPYTAGTNDASWQSLFFEPRSADGQLNLSIEDNDNVASFLKNGNTIESEF